MNIMLPRRKKLCWSFSHGERGRNRVRAYEKSPGGDLYLEWYEPAQDGSRQRVRVKLNHRDRERAREHARKAAAKLELLPAEPAPKPTAAPLTLTRLLTEYLEEVTPTKGRSKQGHDRRAAKLFLAFFDAQDEPARRSTRHPSTLDRMDWGRFVAARRAGRIAGSVAVRDRQVQYDLKFLIAVLSWALGVKDEGGQPYLTANPWGEEIRKAQRWERPREQNPTRVAMTDEVRAALIAHAPHWQFSLALVMERHTRRRNNQIRQLRWNDVDLDGRRIRWRGETDKAGREYWTPMPEAVHESLRDVPRGIGDSPVFPSASDPVEPTPRDTFQTWLRRAKKRAGIQIPGLGFHSEKRAGVRDPRFRALPDVLQEELAGTNYATLKEVYDEVSFADLEEAQRQLDRRTA
jgi:integrase